MGSDARYHSKSWLPREMWQETLESAPIPAEHGSAIPFGFSIPQNARESGEAIPEGRGDAAQPSLNQFGFTQSGPGTTIWRLQMKGKVAMTTIYASFDLPVFREHSNISEKNLDDYEAARKNIVNLLE